MTQPAPHPSRRLRPLLAYLLVLLCGTAFHAAWRASDLAHRRALADQRRLEREFGLLCGAVVPQYRRPRAEVERELNGGRRFEGTEETVHRVGLFADPTWTLFDAAADPADPTSRPATRPATGPATLPKATSFRTQFSGAAVDPSCAGWTVHVHFRNDRLVSARGVGPHRPPYRGPPASWHTFRVFGRWLAGTGAAAWAGCMVVLLFNWRFRAAVAAVAYAALFLGAVGWATEPAAAWVPRAIRPHLQAGALLAAVTTLVVALVPPRARTRTGPPRCSQCGYDLTGNESGVCPECGTLTARGLVDRWSPAAEQIEHVGEAEGEGYGSQGADPDTDDCDAARDPIDGGAAEVADFRSGR